MKDAFLTFLIVSFVYIVTFSLTFGFVFPLQQLLFSGVSTQVGLLFLPHGVRVIHCTSMDGEGCSIFYRRAT